MSRQILVLGIHRSGSSCLAGVLHHLGISMGFEFIPPDGSNPKGYYEDLEFVKANESLIGNWTTPHTEISDASAKRFQELIEKRDQVFSIWGAKDPRLCITASHIACLLSEPRIIVSARPFESAVRSMAARYGSAKHSRETIKKEARRVQTIYNEELQKRVRELRHLPMLSVNFDSLVDSTRTTIEKLIEFTFEGLPKPNAKSFESAVCFVEPSERHFSIK